MIPSATLSVTATFTPTTAVPNTATQTRTNTPPPPTATRTHTSTPLPPTATSTPTSTSTLFSDNFNRADSTNLGSQWTERNGDFGIVAQTLQNLNTDLDIIASANSGTYSNVAVTAKLQNNGSLGAVALGLRWSNYSSGVPTAGYGVELASNGELILWRINDWTELGRYTISGFTPGQWITLTLRANGSTLSVEVEGITRIIATDSTFASGEVGVWSWNSSVAGEHRFDDFSVNTSFAPTATPTYTPVLPTATRTRTNTPLPPTVTRTPTRTRTNTPLPPTVTRTPTQTRTNTPLPPTATATPIPEVVNPADIATLAAGTNVLLDFNNYPNPSDGEPIPANYAGCMWNSLVQGAPWAGITTWNFYIANGGTQGSITFPRPVIVKSVRVSSSDSNLYTLSSAGNADVSITTSGNNPQTLITGWTNPITTLIVRSSPSDQAIDDLRLTTSDSAPTSTPTVTALPTYTPTTTPTLIPTNTATPTPTSTYTSTATSTSTATPTPTFTATPTNTPTFTPTSTVTNTPTPTSTPTPTATIGLGLERYWTYQLFTLSDRVAVNTNVWNGNVIAQYTAFSIPSRGLPLELVFAYNSLTNAWTHNLNWSLMIDVTGSVTLRDGDGTEHFFRREADGSYTTPAGNYDTLVRNADQTFTLTHPDQTQHRFDANGRLTQIRDRRGNAITLTYTNGQLTQAQAAGGQTLTFAYSNGVLSSITDHTGRAFQLGYTSGALTSITDPMNYVTRLAYTNNRLTTITDARNTPTTMAYDASNRVQTITTAGVRVASFAYGTSTTTFTDANNNATTYTLNATGQVTQIRDALNGTTTFTYDANYNVTQTTDALGRITRATYDARGNLLTQTNAPNQTTTYTYNATNDLLSVTDPLGRVTRYTYDAAGTLTSVTDALNNVTTYGYDAYGQRTSATDALNRTTTYAYNAAGLLASTTDALNGVTAYGYDAVGNRTSVTDALNRTTAYVYDANNRLTQVNAPLGATTRYEYDANGNRTVTIDALNQRTTFTYDAFNRQTTITDALNQTTQYQYDANGNRTRVIDANGNATHYQYDALNRLTRITDALNNATQYGYDAVGNQTSITDARGNTTTYQYDALNRVTAVTIPITGTLTGTTRYEYDAVGNRTRVIDANNNATAYQYDALNRVTRVTDAQNNATQYGYDAVGNRTSVTDAANQTTTYAYDALNRVTTVTNPSGKTQRTTYDAVSNRLTTTDEMNQTTRYAYDALNRVISVTNPLTQTTTYGYNAVGNVTTITNPVGQITNLSYDAVNRLTRKTTPLGTTQYAYDAVGNLRVLTDPSGATTTYTYDAVNRIIQQDDRAPGGALVVSYTFAYDANGNKTSETETRPGKPARVTTYAYNKANWLITTTDPGGTTTYNYDAVGNRTSTVDPLGITTAVTYNALNLPAQTTHSTNPLVDTTTNTYDARQNLQRATTVFGSVTLTTTYGYNANNYLSALNNATQGTQSMSSAYTLTYADNNLVASVNELPYYYWDTIGPLYYYDAANRLICTDRPHLYGSYPVFVQIWKYDSAGRRIEQYNNYIHPPVGSITCPSDMYGGHRSHHDFTTYTYEGNKLVYRNTDHYYANDYWWHVSDSTYNYDAAGNLTTEVRHQDNLTTTLTYGWTWQGNAQRLTSFASTSGITVTFDYDNVGRIVRRYTAQGYSDYTYEDGTDWLVRETWHAAQSGNTFDLVRYRYTNGRPSYVEIANVSSDLQTLNGYTAYYLQYNWHGDVVAWVAPDGGGINTTTLTTDPWGVYSSDTLQYYLWNGAWGYLYFSQLKLYYVHGRWYSPDTGLFLSPDANGEYLYGLGQDAVNWSWLLWGFNCQFYSDITLGLGDQQLFSLYRCQDFSGTELFVGRLVGRAASDLLAYLEMYVGGATFVGGGGVTLLSGGTLAEVSVPAAIGGAALTAHGATVLVRNALSPIAFAKKSGTSGDPPAASTYRDRFYQRYPNAPRDYKIHHRIPQKAREMGKFPPEVVDGVDNLRAVPEQIHWQINSEWADFWRRNPNPTQKQILDFAKHIDEIYGQHFWQP